MGQNLIPQEIKCSYEKIKTTTGEEADKWFNHLLWTIARHSAGEELVMYPMFEKLGTDGKALADKSRADHHKTKEALEKLDGKKVDLEVRAKIDDMMDDLLEHIGMEEGPDGDLEVGAQLLRHRFSEKELIDAGKSFARSKKLAPTHPHPDAPDKGPFATVTGLLVAPVDKLRDVFRSFPEETEDQH